MNLTHGRLVLNHRQGQKVVGILSNIFQQTVQQPSLHINLSEASVDDQAGLGMISAAMAAVLGNTVAEECLFHGVSTMRKWWST